MAISWSCACNRQTVWADDAPALPPCLGCSHCGTGYARTAGYHPPLEPHEWAPQALAGSPRKCKRCGTLEVK